MIETRCSKRALELFQSGAGTNSFLTRNAPQHRGDTYIAAMIQAATFRNKSSARFRARLGVRDAAQMRRQYFHIAIVRRQHGHELIALRQRQPHAAHGNIEQQRPLAIRPYTEIYRCRGISARDLRTHDIIAGRALAR